MQLEELYDYKNEVMRCLCSNPNIVQLLTDSESAPVPNYDLIYSNIFPYEFIPETVNSAQTFICFDVDIVSVPNKTFYYPALYVWVFTHKSKLRLPQGGLRLDQLAVEINKEFNGSRRMGLGEMNLQSVGRFVPILDYQGRVLSFLTKDTNRPRPSQEPPINRKLL